MLFQSELLRTVRARRNDPKVKRIRHVSIPRRIVDVLHQYELNSLVPSVVLRESVSFFFAVSVSVADVDSFYII